MWLDNASDLHNDGIQHILWCILMDSDGTEPFDKLSENRDRLYKIQLVELRESWGVLCWMWMGKEVGNDGEGMRTVSVGFKCWFWRGNMMSWLSSCQSNIHREGCVLSSVLKHSFALLLPRLLESQKPDKECQGGFELIAN